MIFLSVYSGVVNYDWTKLERQPLYVKGSRKDNQKQGHSIELAVDRSGDDAFRGESFRVFGPMITDAQENTDVEIKINPDLSSFISQRYGSPEPYIVLSEFAEKVKK